MLAFSRAGWTVVGDGHEIHFEAVWDHTHIAGTLTADRDEIVLEAPGKSLVFPTGVFEQLAAKAIVAAHTVPPPGAP